MHTTTTIDWLSYTLAWNASPLATTSQYAQPEHIAETLFPGRYDWQPEKPRLGYAWVLSAVGLRGLQILISDRRSPQGVHVQLSGTALAHIGPWVALEDTLDLNCKIKRIDIACDLHGYINLEMLYKFAKSGDAVTLARQVAHIRSNSGETVYIGSRASEKYLRLYDKGAEQRAREHWFRAELECKGEYANAVAHHIQQHGPASIPAIIRGFCDFPTHRMWKKWMNTLHPSPTLPKAEKRTDTEKWLHDAVAPSLARVLREDIAAYRRVIDRVLTLAGIEAAPEERDIFDGKGDFNPPLG